MRQATGETEAADRRLVATPRRDAPDRTDRPTVHRGVDVLRYDDGMGDLIHFPGATIDQDRGPRRTTEAIVHTFGPDLRYLGPVRLRIRQDAREGFTFDVPKTVRVDGDLVPVEAISPFPPNDPRFRPIPLDAHARAHRLDAP